MIVEVAVLAGSAAATGVVHTAAGPDHVLPFLALARLKGWSLRRTLGMTLLCGLGHAGSSILLGAVGAWLGTEASRVMRARAVAGISRPGSPWPRERG